MTKTEFNEIDKENEYISNLLSTHREKISERFNSFFSPLYKEIKPHGFIFCVHTHYHPVVITIYDGTEEDSHRLSIKDFKITETSVLFPSVVLNIVEEWLELHEEKK